MFSLLFYCLCDPAIHINKTSVEASLVTFKFELYFIIPYPLQVWSASVFQLLNSHRYLIKKCRLKNAQHLKWLSKNSTNRAKKCSNYSSLIIVLYLLSRRQLKLYCNCKSMCDWGSIIYRLLSRIYCFRCSLATSTISFIMDIDNRMCLLFR